MIELRDGTGLPYWPIVTLKSDRLKEIFQEEWTGPTPEGSEALSRTIVDDWCEKAFKDRWVSFASSDSVVWAFATHGDAIHFKLRWR